MAGWKYRKRVRLMPGVTINISKTGLSTTVGPRGASVNFGRSGAFLNTGIPGTGIYNRQKIGAGRGNRRVQQERKTQATWSAPYAWEEESEIIWEAYDFELLGSTSTRALEQAIAAVMEEKAQLEEERRELELDIREMQRRIRNARQWLYGYLFKGNEEKHKDLQVALSELDARIQESKVHIQSSEDSELKSWDNIIHAFQKLRSSEFIWDISAEKEIDHLQLKTAAKKEYIRVKTILDFDSLDVIDSDVRALHFVNVKGMDIYLFPTLAIIRSTSNKFIVYDYEDLKLSFERVEFVEESTFRPKDAELLRTTWQRINANGEPDRRFKDNRQVPIFAYGIIRLFCDKGFEEAYLFSNAESAENFVELWRARMVK